MKTQDLLFCLLLTPLAAQSTLPGTAPLTLQGDLAAQMVDSINEYLVRESATTPAARSRFWRRDFSNAEAYSRSIEPNRQHLARMLGAVDAPLDRSSRDG